MIISNPIAINYIQSSDGSICHCKVFDIGPWNMDTTVNWWNTLPADKTKILGAYGILWNDSLTAAYPITYDNITVAKDLYLGYTNTQITITRTGGGFFDNVAFSSTAVNRGRVHIWWTD